MPYAILGTGRSGTSMVARMLNLSGLYMGNHAVISDFGEMNREWNPKGYWEHPLFHSIMDRLFKQFGGEWENPPVFPPNWEDDPKLDKLYREASDRVGEEFGGHPEWAWKLPKATVAIGFWRRVIPELKFIVCVRNPLDFAASMSIHYKLSRSHLFAMWQYYNFKVLASTTPNERFITFYEDYFPDYRNGLLPLLEYVGLPDPTQDTDAAHEIEQFHDRGLKHFTSSLEDVLFDQDLAYATQELYLELMSNAPRGESIRMLSHSAMLLPLMERALVGESVLDCSGAVSRAQFREFKKQRHAMTVLGKLQASIAKIGERRPNTNRAILPLPRGWGQSSP